MALGGSLDTPQKGWVDATIDQMKGGSGAGRVGAGLANGLNGGGLQGAGNWVDQQINSMKGGAGTNPAAVGVDISAQGAANWVNQATGSGKGGGGLGGLGGGPQLGALGGNFGGDPLQQQAEAERNRQMMQMMGTAGLAPGGGLGAANPLGGLI
ncbi:hypothetical protein IV102_36155 [bacterium]|nr:hypothetical protein [bacterium]